MKKAKVIVKGLEPRFFEDEVYEVTKEFRAVDLFDPEGKEADFVLIKNELGLEQELHADSVEFV